MDWQTFKTKHGAKVLKVAAYLMTALLAALGTWLGVPREVKVEKEVTVEKTVIKEVPVVESAGDAEHSYGWTPPDAEQLILNLDPVRTLQFADTPAGRAVLGDEDVFLWQAVRKVNNRGPPWYSNIDQGSVGCCVGAGFKHAVDVLQATQMAAGRRAEWKPISAEVIYGMSRVDVGGGRISGDGSVGAWAAQAIKTLGVAPMQSFGSTDLTQFSPARARQYGRSPGVPPEVKSFARSFPVKGTALVKSWTDVKRATQQGYPTAVCSNVGFEGQRDSTGLISPRGTWNHCMAIIAVATANGRERAFILNSWGDQIHRGGKWPADMPDAGFWASSEAVDRMVRQGDSFALSDAVGFPSRKPLDWNVRRNPLEFDRGFALAP